MSESKSRVAEGFAWEKEGNRCRVADFEEKEGNRCRVADFEEKEGIRCRVADFEEKEGNGWKIADNPLFTPWARDIDPTNPLPEYPRPQMVRREWKNLNGLWDYAIRARDAEQPKEFDGQILVPFPVESALSGVKRPLTSDQCLWYRRTFSVASSWRGQRILLHFGAVDWQTTVLLNGEEIGSHRGGYDPFTYDITDYIQDGENELVVRVWDPTTDSYQPFGKQHLNPHGIWFIACSGIWQTVWLEPVPREYIKSIKLTPDIDSQSITVAVQMEGNSGGQVEITVRDGDKTIARESGSPNQPVTVEIPNMKLWSPDIPHLYDLEVKLVKGDITDQVTSYFGMRKIEIQQDDAGFWRLALNGKALFQYGPLDQGYWPDGLYTAPTDDALRYDVELMKEFGFNMVRKHVKIEPARWYYWCDRLGLMVWQDMPSGETQDKIFVRRNRPDAVRSPESEAVYRREYEAMVRFLYNHSSVVAWVPFNEGWGQFKTREIHEWAMQLDPTRLVDGPSGWEDRGIGHMRDTHHYPGPIMEPLEEGRAAVIGEFGSAGYVAPDHSWPIVLERRARRAPEEAFEVYKDFMRKLKPLVAKGVAAAVYTQITDQISETGGFATFDRMVKKFPPEEVRKLHQALYEQPPVLRYVLKCGEQGDGPTWQYTTNDPGEGWHKYEFDDSSWGTAKAPFGNAKPLFLIKTPWNTEDIWLRQVFDINSLPKHSLCLNARIQDQAEIYLNGELLTTINQPINTYQFIDCGDELGELVKKGNNVLAAHCRSMDEEQHIDVGIVELMERDGQ